MAQGELIVSVDKLIACLVQQVNISRNLVEHKCKVSKWPEDVQMFFTKVFRSKFREAKFM